MHIFDYLKDVVTLQDRKACLGYDLQIKTPTPSVNKKYSVDNVKKAICIYVENLSPKEKRTFKKGIKALFDNSGLILIEESKISLLDKLYTFNKKNDKDKQTLSFFENVLSKGDFEALRDSMFLKSEFSLGHPINVLKHDISARYGERGNVISNLCTAGYFEDVMIDLYNLSSDHRHFYEYYDLAVDRGLTALFVNTRMSVAKIREEINRRINSAKSYGLSYIHIHGIGKTNITNIKKCIKKVKDTSKINFTEKNIFTADGLPILVVEIIL